MDVFAKKEEVCNCKKNQPTMYYWPNALPQGPDPSAVSKEAISRQGRGRKGEGKEKMDTWAVLARAAAHVPLALPPQLPLHWSRVPRSGHMPVATCLLPSMPLALPQRSPHTAKILAPMEKWECEDGKRKGRKRAGRDGEIGTSVTSYFFLRPWIKHAVSNMNSRPFWEMGDLENPLALSGRRW